MTSWQYFSNYLSQEWADRLLAYSCSPAIEWHQNSIKMYGKQIPVPRREAILGDAGCSYRYAGILLEPQPWQVPLEHLRDRIQSLTGARFSIVIGNQYRSGADHIGWHSDDSPEIGAMPTIASLSLGAKRRFQLRHKQTKLVTTLELAHGDLLVMLPGCQEEYVHRICKNGRLTEQRVNWTFRPHIKADAQQQELFGGAV